MMRSDVDPTAALAGDWSRTVVFFGATAWDGNMFASQHLAQRLAHYAPVLYVDPVRSAREAIRSGGPRACVPELRVIDERLLRLTPVAPPGPTRFGLRSITRATLRRVTTRALAHLGARVDVVVGVGLSPSLDFSPSRLKVLYGTDDFVAGAELMGLSRSWLQRLERTRLREADLTIAVSDELAAKWRPHCKNLHIIENGCDVEMFGRADESPTPSDVRLPAPIAGFVGHLSERIDLRMLEAVAQGGHSLLLVGPRQHTFAADRISKLLRRPNVQWVGAKPFAELPAYLGAMSVGLVPYTDTPFNRASSPLKTLEYLAAGRPTIVTDIPAMRRLPTDVVTIRTSPESYASAVAQALAAPPDHALSARRRAVAMEHSWDARAARLALLAGLPSTAVAGCASE